MDFKKDVKDILTNEIHCKADYTDSINRIQEKMIESARHSNYNIDNMRFFYRGDSKHAPLCPKIFLDKSCLSTEGSRFREKFKLNKNAEETELHFLCRLQHEFDCTRLLDFSTDSLVALRFACGRDSENYEKRVTMIYTDHIKENNYDYLDDEVATLLKMVKSDNLCNFDEKEKRQLSKDYFIVLTDLLNDIERCKRQKGAFLFPGNFRSINTPVCYEKKVAHRLSRSIGRGKDYIGYIVNIPIDQNYVGQLRKELDETKKYSIKYLLAEE